ncbi:MAG TPA: hypothetical protein DCW72_06730 [Elusimicrobia bacterium]|nr:MAG: hypothetical protein A2X29_00235 [Elusimicrobia bacterium GWA2_64_40]OGR63779.1 MAG: hypothetical protein A2X30_09165 [Elusimicrobia bacterium GWB2_63_16]HAN05475.1 hypothetical protein [Elusimicrobiota bacterium]HAU89915.1 hypothetical protein [Elusimicrobiota bacterium]
MYNFFMGRLSKGNKILILSAGAVLLSCCGAAGAVFSVIGPCSENPVFELEFPAAGAGDTAGQISERIFKENGLPYEGGAGGFTSILGSPSGLAAVEVVSAKKTRFYGWCFSSDGVLPEVTPDAFYPDATTARLTWFYAFSTYENGNWTDSCVPSYTVKAAQFCGPEAGAWTINWKSARTRSGSGYAALESAAARSVSFFTGRQP